MIHWMTHRLLGPSGAYWTTGRPTGWPTGFWGLLGLTEQLAGQLDDPQASGAFWGLLNNWQANWMTHRLLGAFWGLLNNWQANWMTHRLLGPSRAYWATDRPTGWPTGFWPSGAYWTIHSRGFTEWPTGFWGLLGLTGWTTGFLEPSRLYWMTHRLLGLLRAYWTIWQGFTEWPTGLLGPSEWAYWGFTEQPTGFLGCTEWPTYRAYWMTHRLPGALLNDPLNDPLFVQCKLTAGPTERPTIGFSCAYLNDWFKCRSVGWPSWVNFRSRWSVWLGDLNESICPILIGWLSVLVGWPFKLLTWVSCFRWLWWSDWFTNLIHLVRWPG